jgi:hypothetical protein
MSATRFFGAMKIGNLRISCMSDRLSFRSGAGKQSDFDCYVEKMREDLKERLKHCNGIRLKEGKR